MTGHADVTIYQRDSTYIMTTKTGMPGMLGRTYPFLAFQEYTR